jgi:phosphoserine aminotransferase
VDRKIGVQKQRCNIPEADVILLFAADRKQLDSALPSMLAKAPKNAIIWIAYPKLTSKLAGDLSRNLIHARAAEAGLDTVSQIAIDDDWSAMRVKRTR